MVSGINAGSDAATRLEALAKVLANMRSPNAEKMFERAVQIREYPTALLRKKNASVH